VTISNTSSPVYVIAEAGVNHNGDFELAKRLVEVAKEAGADAVKFQTFRTEENVSIYTPLAEYQSENLGTVEGGQLEMLKSLELSFKNFRELKAFCDDMGIDFISTPDDKGSVDLLSEIEVPYVKTASAEITNLPFLKMVAGYGIPMIVSTGMSTLGEVENAIQAIYSTGNHNVTVLHCTSDYPCDLSDVNLRAMVTLRHSFGVPVGYSDHTVGMDVAVAAVALGANVIEKHFTLDKGMVGPDHAASLSPQELADYITKIREASLFLGDGAKRPQPSEMVNRPAMRRSLVATRDIREGTQLSEDLLIFKRPGTGISPEHLGFALGKRVNRNVAEDEVINWDDIG